jgi:hypothetical protein
MRLFDRLFSRSPATDCSQLLHALLAEAIITGLLPRDAQNAQEMLNDDEPILCFDIIANQFHSYDLELTPAFYDLLATTGQCLNVASSTYCFNQELIRSSTHIPKPVRQQLASLLASLQGRACHIT